MSEASNPVPNVEAGPVLPESVAYRPLSILALIGFVLAALYALFLLGGGLVAFFQRDPWLLPVWFFVFPMTAALLSWLARTRILDSEGALSGLSLARWGIVLSLVCGLLYAAYYTATYIAVRQQASVYTDRFVQMLKEGNPEQAFLLSLRPLERQSAQQDPRETLEISHNTPMRGGPGDLSRFKQHEWVRLLQLSGEQAQVRPLGMSGWKYDRNGYQVALQYHIDSPLASFDLQVSAVGQQVRSAPTKGRQWYIVLNETGVTPESKRTNEEGNTLLRLGMGARAHASRWLGRRQAGQITEMYLETLPLAKREQQRRAGDICRLCDAAAVTGPAPLALFDASCWELQQGCVAIARGSIIQADPQTFWAPARTREEIIKKVKELFDPSRSSSYQIMLSDTAMPLWQRVNGELVFSFPATLMLPDADTGKPQYLVECNLKMAVPEDKVSANPPPWYVVGMELVSAHSAPKSDPGGRPGRK